MNLPKKTAAQPVQRPAQPIKVSGFKSDYSKAAPVCAPSTRNKLRLPTAQVGQ